MRIGVPTEIKPDEYRVAITPAGVRELCARGHEVFVQAGAGIGSALADEQFQAQGATILDSAEAVFERGELILKVKEPQPPEVETARGETHAFHLPPSRRRAGACRGVARLGGDLHRL